MFAVKLERHEAFSCLNVYSQAVCWLLTFSWFCMSEIKFEVSVFCSFNTPLILLFVKLRSDISNITFLRLRLSAFLILAPRHVTKSFTSMWIMMFVILQGTRSPHISHSQNKAHTFDKFYSVWCMFLCCTQVKFLNQKQWVSQSEHYEMWTCLDGLFLSLKQLQQQCDQRISFIWSSIMNSNK